ncbi:ethanolamine ammonia-lyase subunit EutC [Granulicella sp. L46]|uniref:ethanolamine ammonia-lyase subunit EutC n=1 Tax=Granulicella sp. L46 TaxID=1641865 RepID=UPI00131E4DEE|nr:ethanolamine ammonia-lyase subunit EutC [Granulicella sp. L46]
MTDTGVKRAAPNLRSLTAARVSLPMSGHSIATSEVLEFQLAHAQARDAVHAALDTEAFARRLRDELPMLAEQGVEVLTLRSCAVDRARYLRHPQRGRSLDAASAAVLKSMPCDLAITIADGLSALAVERNAVPLLAVLLPRMAKDGWTMGPVTVVQQGRVGVCDAIGERLGARCSLILIGERPGLSAADSMGAYLTWQPRVGRTDADRNCLSNIRSGGLNVEEAAERLMGLMKTARTMKLTGVALKEGAGASLLEG